MEAGEGPDKHKTKVVKIMIALAAAGRAEGEEEKEKEGECLAYCVRTMNANEESEQRMRQTLPRSCPIVGWGRAGGRVKRGNGGAREADFKLEPGTAAACCGNKWHYAA